jgi:hypothetical protein
MALDPMNRNTPLVVLTSLVGSFAIYCSSAVVDGGGGSHRGSVGDANAETPPSAGAACCEKAPQFTKLAEGDLTVTVSGSGNEATRSGEDVDVSGYRQITVLEKHDTGCTSVRPATQFKFDASGDHWGEGLSPGSLPIPVLAPIARVNLVGWRSSTTTPCTARSHYVVLGLK